LTCFSQKKIKNFYGSLKVVDKKLKNLKFQKLNPKIPKFQKSKIPKIRKILKSKNNDLIYIEEGITSYF